MQDTAELDATSATGEVWRWVRELIADVGRDQAGEAFAQRLGAWDAAVRSFRRIEDARMHLAEPTALDRRFHKLCLHGLIAEGHSLVLHSQRFDPAGLQRLGIRHDAVEAYVADLEESLRDWSNDLTPRQVADAQKRIFGAEA